jgi:Xaa-Pro aminopeptidase
MFSKEVYINRRQKLKSSIDDGILIFLGNNDSPMNFPSNTYPYRQDSTFLYYWGLDESGLFAVIDLNNGDEILFGNDRSLDDVIWMGPSRTFREKAENVGVAKTMPSAKFMDFVKEEVKKGRKIHFLNQYRHDNILLLSDLLNSDYKELNKKISEPFTRQVIRQRSIKSNEEVHEIEKALDTSFSMYMYAFKRTRPGMREQEIAGGIEGIALQRGRGVSFPTIFSIHGEILHNHHHKNIMRNGDLVVLDSGAESFMHYASDITRSYPVSGKFTNLQRDIYSAVLDAQIESIRQIRPGKKYKEIHLLAAKIITDHLKDVGLMKGNTDDAVAAGAHALFFPHGLGHMMGLDVHDMEVLGENYVGYENEETRSDQFGLAFLRLARALRPGYVITVEPGIYFIPKLVEMWKGEKKHAEFIDYDKVERMLGFGGIRIEDDVLVTRESFKVLGRPIPKTIEDVEQICQ